MKQFFTLVLILTIAYGCKQHPDIKKDGGLRITVEASVGDLLKQSIIPGDSIANAAIAETYKEYNQQTKSFTALYFSKLEKADPVHPAGSHFKADGLSASAKAAECTAFFDEELIEKTTELSVILNERIGSEFATVSSGQKAEQVIVEISGRNDVERIRKLLQSTANLAFWETYDNGEVYPMLDKLNTELGKEQAVEHPDTVVKREVKGTLKEQLAAQKDQEQDEKEEKRERLKKENPLFAVLNPAIGRDADDHAVLESGPVIGYAAYADTAKVNKYLQRIVHSRMTGGYLKFLWSNKPLKNSDVFALVAIKTNRDDKALLSGKIIVKARKVSGEVISTSPADIVEKVKKIFDDQQTGAPQISMTMTKEAGFTWMKMTGDNIGKSIAIVVDGGVYSYPTVQGEIKGGVSSITGNFTSDEADDLVSLLNSGYLPLPVKIVQEEVVPAAK